MTARGDPPSARDSAGAAELPGDVLRDLAAVEARLDGTHWEALGVPWGAPPEKTRGAYLELVKRFHPDRHGGARLGPVRQRLERAVRRLTTASDVLSDPARCAAYAEATAPPDEVARRETRRIEDALHAEERRARLGRSSPLVARAARVGELVLRAKGHLAAEQPHAAVNDLATALALDPRHVEAEALLGDARRRANALGAQEHYEEGLRHEAAGREELALERFCAGAELAPRDARLAAGASRAALRLGRPEEALRHAEAAAVAGPRHAHAQLALGAALLAKGDRSAARRALQRAIELDAGLAEARALLRQTRWRLFR